MSVQFLSIWMNIKIWLSLFIYLFHRNSCMKDNKRKRRLTVAPIVFVAGACLIHYLYIYHYMLYIYSIYRRVIFIYFVAVYYFMMISPYFIYTLQVWINTVARLSRLLCLLLAHASYTISINKYSIYKWINIYYLFINK